MVRWALFVYKTIYFQNHPLPLGTAKLPEDCEDIQEEIQQLEQKLKEKQDELFQLQRNSYRHKVSLPKKKSETFIRPQVSNYVLNASRLRSLFRNLVDLINSFYKVR